MFKNDSSFHSLVTSQKWSSEDEEKGVCPPRLQLSPELSHPGATSAREKGKCNIYLFLGRGHHRSYMKLVAGEKGPAAYLRVLLQGKMLN